MNIVDQIITGFNTRIEAAVAGINKLDYILDVSKNSFRGNALRYGVRAVDADSVPGVLKSFTLDHNFEVILTEPYKNIAKNDINQRDKTGLLFNRLDEISVDVYNSKLGISNIVYLVELVFISEPEYLEEEDVAILRGSFKVKYRRNL